jgi:hypothetical protein
MTDYHYYLRDVPVPRSAAIIVAVALLIGHCFRPCSCDVFGNNLAKMMKTFVPQVEAFFRCQCKMVWPRPLVGHLRIWIHDTVQLIATISFESHTLAPRICCLDE